MFFTTMARCSLNEMQIGKHDTDEKVFIIAEIGNNHEGDFDLARKMVRSAAEAGADAVKFQTIAPEELVSPMDENRIKQLSRFQFNPDQFRELSFEAEECGVVFMSTPFDLSAVKFLDPIVPVFKIASGDNDFWPLIDCVANTGKPLIISMGLGQVENADSLIKFVENSTKKNGRTVPEIALLYCVVSYPAPIDQVCISGINQLNLGGVTAGFSDHTIGIRASELAVAAGARIIEKHFTLDKDQSDFRDHQLSADPDEFAALVKVVREVEGILGDSTKPIKVCEAGNERLVRRSIAAVRDITVDERVTWDDLCWVRPRVGLKPGEENLICGRKLTKNIVRGEAFTMAHFE